MHHSSIHHRLVHLYHKKNIKNGLLPLLLNRSLLSLAHALFGIFIPIFLYQILDNSISLVLVFYLINNALFALFIPLGAIIMTKIGFKNSLLISTIFTAGISVCLYFISVTGNLLYLIPLQLTWNISRMFYWTAYHTDFAKFSDKKHRALEVGIFLGVLGFIQLVVPFFTGIFIDVHGFNLLYIAGTIIVLFSAIPLFFIQEIKEKYSYGYFETFAKLASKKWKKIFLPYASDGAEFIIGNVIWPIFIFGLLNEKYTSVGIISALVGLFTIVFRLYIGRLADRISKHKVLKYGNLLYSFFWIVKAFVETFFQIFIVNALHRIILVVRSTSYYAIGYQQASDQKHFIDEYCVLREINVCIGRILMISVLLIFLQFTPIHLAFFLAAGISLILNLI